MADGPSAGAMASPYSAEGTPGSQVLGHSGEDKAPFMDTQPGCAASDGPAAAGIAAGGTTDPRRQSSSSANSSDSAPVRLSSGSLPGDEVTKVHSDAPGLRRSRSSRVSELAETLKRSFDSVGDNAKKHAEVKSNRHKIMQQLLNEEELGITSSTRGSVNSLHLTRCRKAIRSVVLSQYFDLSMALVVGLNCFIMALESEIPDMEHGFQIVDWVFNVVYTVEATMRWSVYRRHYFKSAVNILDLVIVFCGWVTSFATAIEGEGRALNKVAALKVLRALRALRFCRMISFFEGIWIVFSSFMRCMRPLFWTCLFVAVIVFIFTMFAVELIGTSDVFEGVAEQKYFETTVICFVTLFQVMTLDEWRSVTQPLCDKAWWTYIFFLIYICIAALALMNLVTAVIVENAMLTIREDEEVKKRDLRKDQEIQKEKILQLFRVCHRKTEGDKIVTEMNINSTRKFAVTADDVADMSGHWGTLQGILESFAVEDKSDIQRLMVLLDTDGNGRISLTEMLEGILDLRSVMEDHNRIALLHTTKNRDHKFQMIERLIAQKRAPEICCAKLARIEGYLSALGLQPPPDEDEEAAQAAQATPQPQAEPHSGDDAANSAGYAEAAAPPEAQVKMNENQLLVQRLRKLRFGLQRQGKELREQRQEIERLEVSVDNMLKSSPRAASLNSRPGSAGPPSGGSGGTSRVPPAAPRSTLNETPPT